MWRHFLAIYRLKRLKRNKHHQVIPRTASSNSLSEQASPPHFPRFWLHISGGSSYSQNYFFKFVVWTSKPPPSPPFLTAHQWRFKLFPELLLQIRRLNKQESPISRVNDCTSVAAQVISRTASSNSSSEQARVSHFPCAWLHISGGSRDFRLLEKELRLLYD